MSSVINLQFSEIEDFGRESSINVSISRSKHIVLKANAPPAEAFNASDASQIRPVDDYLAAIMFLQDVLYVDTIFQIRS